MMRDEDREERFEAALKTALAVDTPPHLAARIGQAVAERRERADLWRLISPKRLALIGALATAAGVAIGVVAPHAVGLDADTLLAAAISGSFT